MAEHEKFHYDQHCSLQADIARLGLEIPFAEEVESLRAPLTIGNRTVDNRMAVLPMEGCDGDFEGKPAELTERRYRRFAGGGAGTLWFEAAAVAQEGRANPRQLFIKKDNAKAFEQLLKGVLTQARESGGTAYRPLTILQLTHSGRYSKPDGVARPIVAEYNPWLDSQPKENIHLITDEEIEQLEEAYVQAALLAGEIGFDAVDVKICHGYLGAELLAAFSRPGRYGGCFENRTRFVRNLVDKIRLRAGDSIQIAVRMNAYDSVPYPFGWGVDKDDFHRPDFSEPQHLASLFEQNGVSLLNVTCGNPYFNPHINRPYDIGTYRPPFHPLEGVANLLGAARAIQAAAPRTAVMATGFSWLRQWGVNVAAAGIKQGWFKLAGFGRLAFAHPGFANEVLATGRIDPAKVCLACSKCTTVMRDGGKAGCVLRDSKIYAPIYRAGRAGKEPVESTRPAENVLGR